MEHAANWSSKGIVQMSYTEERAKQGRRSLRFRTSLRDEGHLQRNRNAAGSFVGEQGGWTSVTRTFSEPQDWSAYNRLSLWVYVHPTSMRTYVFNLEFACRGAADDATTPPAFHTVQDLRPGEWNHVLWEIPHLQRDKVVSLTISQASAATTRKTRASSPMTSTRSN